MAAGPKVRRSAPPRSHCDGGSVYCSLPPLRETALRTAFPNQDRPPPNPAAPALLPSRCCAHGVPEIAPLLVPEPHAVESADTALKNSLRSPAISQPL